AVLANTLVANLFSLIRAGTVRPGVVRDRIGDRLVVLVTQSTRDRGVGDAVGMVRVIADAGLERIVCIKEHCLEGGVLVVRAESPVPRLARRASVKPGSRV